MRSLALWVAWLCLVLTLAGCGVVRLLAQGARALGRETQAEPHPLSTPAPPPTDEAGAESPAAAAGSVPVQTLGSLVLVEATVHGAHTLTLALDTDAVLTLLSPAAAARLGLGPASDAPRRSVAPPGRREVEVPLVRVTAIQVGESLVENLEVGVVEVYPEAPKVDGVLGRDFLGRFGMTLDLAARRLRLRPTQPGAR